MDLHAKETVFDIFNKDGDLMGSFIASFKGLGDDIGRVCMCLCTRVRWGMCVWKYVCKVGHVCMCMYTCKSQLRRFI